jgi:hypothetical protein
MSECHNSNTTCYYVTSKECDRIMVAMGHDRILFWKELLVVYLANQNSMREISDKFNVSKSGYRVVMQIEWLCKWWSIWIDWHWLCNIECSGWATVNNDWQAVSDCMREHDWQAAASESEALASKRIRTAVVMLVERRLVEWTEFKIKCG